MKKIKYTPAANWLSSFYHRISKRKQPKQKYLIYLKDIHLDLHSPYMDNGKEIPLMCPLAIIETLPYAESRVREFFETSTEAKQVFNAVIIDIEYQSEEISNIVLSGDMIHALYKSLVKRFQGSWDYMMNLPKVIRAKQDFVPKITVKGSCESLRYLIGKKLYSLKVASKQNYNKKITSFV